MTREEEIRQEQVRNFVEERITYRDSMIKALLKEAAALGVTWADEHPKNPWRDAMADEPKKGKDVFAYIPDICGGEYCKLTYLGNYRWCQDEGGCTVEFYNIEIFWMPIPELPKGGEK